jgi:hypothetical protein
MKNDPYKPELWNPEVDVIVMVPIERPNNFYWLGRPVSKDCYSDHPPDFETKLIRKGLSSFKSQWEADRWAQRNYNVVEMLHTARVFCWRVRNE